MRNIPIEKRVQKCNWKDIKDINEVQNYNVPGIYTIRLANSKGFAIKIHRFLDNDKDGIIQIGRSKKIKKRLTAFKNACEGGKRKHSGGKRLSSIRDLLDKKYKKYEIQYSFVELQDEEECKKKESKELNDYFNKYGELPPLNNNMPKEVKFTQL